MRDEESGEIWCPTPLPVPSAEPTLVRHGQGYTTFERNAHGLQPRADTSRTSRRPNQTDPAANSKHERSPAQAVGDILCRVGPRSGPRQHGDARRYRDRFRDRSLAARNAFRTDFGGRVAFAEVDRRPRTVTADRAEFVGRHGSLIGSRRTRASRAVRIRGRGSGSVRRHPDDVRARARRGNPDRLSAGRGRWSRCRPRPDQAISRGREGPRGH